jgi:hypothetical protein
MTVSNQSVNELAICLIEVLGEKGIAQGADCSELLCSVRQRQLNVMQTLVDLCAALPYARSSRDRDSDGKGG